MRTLKELHLNKQMKSNLRKILDYEIRKERTKTICKVLLKYDECLDIEQVIKETGVSRRTIFYYRKQFIKNNFFMLQEETKPTNFSILKDYESVISENFRNQPVKTYKQAQARIEEITGIKRSETQIRNFLIRYNFKKDKKGNYNQPSKKVVIDRNIKNTCLYTRRNEVEKYIDELMPSSPTIMVNKLKERYCELRIFNNDIILEHTRSISPF